MKMQVICLNLAENNLKMQKINKFCKINDGFDNKNVDYEKVNRRFCKNNIYKCILKENYTKKLIKIY